MEAAAGLAHAAERSLSVVLPAWNEATNLDRTLGCVFSALSPEVSEFEVIVVDDGSTDGTAELLQRWMEQEKRLHVVVHPARRGYGAALRSGFDRARCDLVFFTDADGQFDVRELGALLAQSPDYALVVGYRNGRRDPLGRRLLARCWTALVNGLFDLKLRDVNCAFKLLDRRSLQGLEMSAEGAGVNAELFVRAREAGLSWTEVPVSHRQRVQGKASGGRPDVAIRALWELWALRRARGGTAV